MKAVDVQTQKSFLFSHSLNDLTGKISARYNILRIRNVEMKVAALRSQ